MKVIRGTICACLCVCMLTGMISCSDIYEEDYITEVENYMDIWAFPERRASRSDHYDEPLATFPDDISSLDVGELYCWHALYLPVGTGFQIHLSVRYGEEEYAAELERLAALRDVNEVRYDTENLSAPAYVAAWNFRCSYEYALCRDDSLTVDYVYIQLLSGDDIKLDASLLPNGYTGMDYEAEPFSLYDEVTE